MRSRSSGLSRIRLCAPSSSWTFQFGSSSNPFVRRPQRRIARPFQRIDEVATPEPVQVAGQPDPLEERREGMGRRARVEERHRRDAVAGVVDVEIPLPLLVIDQMPARFAVVGHQRVEIHQRVDLVGNTIGDRGDHHAAVAVPDQHQHP